MRTRIYNIKYTQSWLTSPKRRHQWIYHSILATAYSGWIGPELKKADKSRTLPLHSHFQNEATVHSKVQKDFVSDSSSSKNGSMDFNAVCLTWHWKLEIPRNSLIVEFRILLYGVSHCYPPPPTARSRCLTFMVSTDPTLGLLRAAHCVHLVKYLPFGLWCNIQLSNFKG